MPFICRRIQAAGRTAGQETDRVDGTYSVLTTHSHMPGPATPAILTRRTVCGSSGWCCGGTNQYYSTMQPTRGRGLLLRRGPTGRGRRGVSTQRSAARDGFSLFRTQSRPRPEHGQAHGPGVAAGSVREHVRNVCARPPRKQWSAHLATTAPGPRRRRRLTTRSHGRPARRLLSSAGLPLPSPLPSSAQPTRRHDKTTRV